MGRPPASLCHLEPSDYAQLPKLKLCMRCNCFGASRVAFQWAEWRGVKVGFRTRGGTDNNWMLNPTLQAYLTAVAIWQRFKLTCYNLLISSHQSTEVDGAREASSLGTPQLETVNGAQEDPHPFGSCCRWVGLNEYAAASLAVEGGRQSGSFRP